MPFSVPSLEQMRKLARDSIVNAVAAGRPIVRRSIEDAIGNAVGEVQYLHLERLRLMWAQLWPDTATGRWLDRHAAMWGLARKDAGPGSGKIRVTGTASSTLPLGWELTSATGYTYATNAELTLGLTGEGFVTVTATTGGKATNLPAGAELTLASAVAGIDDVVTVVVGEKGEDGIVGGADVEGDEDLRVRILSRIRNPPVGGSVADYINWALEVSGITRAWAYPGVNGPGTVLVLVVDDNGSPIAPGPAKLDEVKAYLQTVAPATDVPGITVAAPTLFPIDHTMVLSPNDPNVQAAVDAALAQFYRLRELGDDVRHSQIVGAIDAVAVEDWHDLTDPAADVPLATYELPVLGTTTYNDPPP